VAIWTFVVLSGPVVDAAPAENCVLTGAALYWFSILMDHRITNSTINNVLQTLGQVFKVDNSALRNEYL